MLVDYHVHTTLSGDSEQTIDSICQDAIKLGIKEICLTEHEEFLEDSFYYHRYNYDNVVKMAEYAKNEYGLSAKIGIEIDYQTQFLSEIYDMCLSYDFDYILGSVHKINNLPVVDSAFYDGKTEKEAYIEYFTKQREMICINMFNGLAHADFMKRGACGYYGKFDPEICKEAVCEMLKELIKRDMCLEVNTNGYYWKDLNDFYPDIKILKWYRELGGENITFGSDSHGLHHLGTKINEMYEVIKSLGFDKITTYDKRIKKMVSID